MTHRAVSGKSRGEEGRHREGDVGGGTCSLKAELRMEGKGGSMDVGREVGGREIGGHGREGVGKEPKWARASEGTLNEMDCGGAPGGF